MMPKPLPSTFSRSFPMAVVKRVEHRVAKSYRFAEDEMSELRRGLKQVTVERWYTPATFWGRVTHVGNTGFHRWASFGAQTAEGCAKPVRDAALSLLGVPGTGYGLVAQPVELLARATGLLGGAVGGFLGLAGLHPVSVGFAASWGQALGRAIVTLPALIVLSCAYNLVSLLLSGGEIAVGLLFGVAGLVLGPIEAVGRVVALNITATMAPDDVFERMNLMSAGPMNARVPKPEAQA